MRGMTGLTGLTVLGAALIGLAARGELAWTEDGRAVSRPAEVWLTPERAAQLRRVTARPYVTARETLPDGREALRWTNGSREWATTNAVRPALGRRAPNGWQDRVEKAEKEKSEVIESVKALKGKGKGKLTDADLDAVIQKAGKAEKAKETRK